MLEGSSGQHGQLEVLPGWTSLNPLLPPLVPVDAPQ